MLFSYSLTSPEQILAVLVLVTVDLILLWPLHYPYQKPQRSELLRAACRDLEARGIHVVLPFLSQHCLTAAWHLSHPGTAGMPKPGTSFPSCISLFHTQALTHPTHSFLLSCPSHWTPQTFHLLGCGVLQQIPVCSTEHSPDFYPLCGTSGHLCFLFKLFHFQSIY